MDASEEEDEEPMLTAVTIIFTATMCHSPVIQPSTKIVHRMLAVCKKKKVPFAVRLASKISEREERKENNNRGWEGKMSAETRKKVVSTSLPRRLIASCSHDTLPTIIKNK